MDTLVPEIAEKACWYFAGVSVGSVLWNAWRIIAAVAMWIH